MFFIDGRRLCDDANALPAVFLEVLIGAGIDEVDLQVFMELSGRRPAAGHIPEIDVVGAEVFEGEQGAGQGGKVGLGG